MIFIENKYTKWYNSIVCSNKARDGYTETHHIIPKCLGGTNDKSNLVVLTAREHFICHWLLTKMVSSKRHRYQMWNALSSMLYWHNPLQTREKISSHKYQILKTHISKQKSIKFAGEGNAMFNKHHSEKTRAQMRVSHLANKEERSAMQKEIAKNEPPEKKAARYAKSSSKQKGIPKPKFTCEHCGKTVGSHGNYTQWHGPKCKLNTVC